MRKHRNSVPDEAADVLVAEYQNGASYHDLAARFDVSGPTMAQFLKRHGVQLRTRREINKLRAPVDLDVLRRLIEEGVLSQREIAEQLGVSQPTIERTLREHGIRSKRGRGSKLEKNYFWAGGRTLDSDGYVLVKVTDHPFADNRGYVREHRLVMEEFLGRYLQPSEVVHHKDGDHGNNRISNLQLFENNAEHLRHELMGETPNYSPEGLQRMRENAQRVNRQRYASNQTE